MGKYERKKSRKTRKRILPALVLTGLLAALPMLLWFGRNTPQQAGPEAETTVPTVQGPAEDVPGETEVPELWETVQGLVPGETVDFPVSLEGGALMLDSLFPFEGFNPDCGNLEGSKTAAVLIRNTSERYLKSATVRVALEDGSIITFAASDLPPGKELLAFSVENAELEDTSHCVGVQAETVFEDACVPEGIAVGIDGLTVTVTNESQTEINRMDVLCHGSFGTAYYGGVTYVYTIEKLEPGESISTMVSECLLGMVEVARIVIY